MEKRKAIQLNNTQRNNTEQTLNTTTKIKSKKFNEIYERGKDYLTITKKHRIENSQVVTYKSTNNITDLNELIYAGSNIVCEKIGIP